ncbi:hypothetical protein M1403_03115 [Patescibacteria group bacterium]|nr:hypothetical protein [Patescibacteria group bacterium]
MQVFLYSQYGRYPKEIEKTVKEMGLEIVKKNPEVVITFGGDGTLLGAERDFPGVPKLTLRNSEICHFCSPLPNEEILKLLAHNQLETRELIKLEADFNKHKLTALNDIVVAHKFPNTALRFRVFTSDQQPATSNQLIGDGVVISTPFGSTGYFNAITHQVVVSGLGLAYNNIHPFPNEAFTIYPEETVIKVTITRGPGVLAADNDPHLIDLKEGDEVVIKKSSQTTKVLIPVQ